MSNARTSDKNLAAAEEIVNSSFKYSYPIAWALSFLLDNQKIIIKLLRAENQNGTATQLKNLCHEIRTGEIS